MNIKNLLLLLSLFCSSRLIAKQDRMMNYYAILEVSPYADYDDLQDAYQDLSDFEKGVPETKLRDVKEAWNFLRDKKKRKIYDDYLPILGHERAVEKALAATEHKETLM